MHKPKSVRSRLAGIALAASCATAHAGEPMQAGDAQPGADASLPRIGLALSGGGARGLAHIGVIQVLDALRVPVHCVTGTSMGAVVGGIFASGVAPARMEEAVLRADWNRIFSDGPPRREMSMRRKADDYKHLFAPELGLTEEGLALPKGVLAGVSIETFFRTLTGPGGDAIDFARLPIPFRAIAADIATGEAVVLHRGSVARALRASMSVPGAVAPVEIDGRLLVDGGIVDNLPIEQARRLCADVVIAVNISTPPLKREEITSALSVSLQLVNLLGKATVEEQLKSLGPHDVLITPELGDISAASFERAADAIRIGQSAARALTEALARYSLPPQQYAELRSRQLRAASDLGTVDEIRFAGLERTNPEVLRSLVRSRAGEPLDQETIGADLRRIYGRGDFEGVDYRIVEEPGRRILLIEPREKSWGPDYLRFGLGFATDFRSDNPFNVLASYRRTWLNRLGGEWLAEAQIGSDPRLFTEWFQPVHEAGRYFVAPYASLGQSTRGVFLDRDRIAEYRIVDARLGGDVGASVSTWGEARLGLLWRRIDANVETGSPVLPDVKETSAGVRARLLADRMDHAWFPRRGHRIILSALHATGALGSERSYRRLEGEASFAASWGAHTLNFNVAGGTDLGSSLPGYEVFSLGGPLRLSGFRIGELAGARMRFARLMYYNRTLPLPDLLGSGVYAGASLEVGRVTRSLVGTPGEGTLAAASIFLGANTFLGPAFLGLGYGEGGRASVYLLLGIP